MLKKQCDTVVLKGTNNAANFPAYGIWLAQQGCALSFDHVQIGTVLASMRARHNLWRVIYANWRCGVFVAMPTGHDVSSVFSGPALGTSYSSRYHQLMKQNDNYNSSKRYTNAQQRLQKATKSVQVDLYSIPEWFVVQPDKLRMEPNAGTSTEFRSERSPLQN